jgi:hypothetical protein
MSVPPFFKNRRIGLMKFFTDDYFHIGKAHLGSGKPCQDYVVSGSDDFAFAVVSDGCSSGGNTDVGSRLLALATASAIKENWILNNAIDKDVSVVQLEMQQRFILAGLQNTLNLNVHDMLATCIYSYICPNGGFVRICGDGTIALKYRSGKIVMHNFEWHNNTPYYPVYKNGFLKQFIDTHGGDLDNICVSEEIWIIDDKESFSSNVKEYSLREGIEGINISIDKQILDELEFIAIFSDGVTQIEGVAWHDAVEDFLSFKNTTGAFAKRRMIRGLKNMDKLGKDPMDDISYAVIGIGLEEVETK